MTDFNSSANHSNAIHGEDLSDKLYMIRDRMSFLLNRLSDAENAYLAEHGLTRNVLEEYDGISKFMITDLAGVPPTIEEIDTLCTIAQTVGRTLSGMISKMLLYGTLSDGVIDTMGEMNDLYNFLLSKTPHVLLQQPISPTPN